MLKVWLAGAAIFASASACSDERTEVQKIGQDTVHIELSGPEAVHPHRAFFRVGVTNLNVFPVCLDAPIGDETILAYINPSTGDRLYTILQGEYSSEERKVEIRPGETISLNGYSPDIGEFMLRAANGSLVRYEAGMPIAVIAGAFIYPCNFSNISDAQSGEAITIVYSTQSAIFELE